MYTTINNTREITKYFLLQINIIKSLVPYDLRTTNKYLINLKSICAIIMNKMIKYTFS